MAACTRGTYAADEREMRVEAKLIRSKDGGGLSDKLRKGDQVEARYHGREKYYKGTISRDHGDGTYDIDYAADAAKIRVDVAKIRVDELLAAAIKEISQENERIESLTQARRSYYSAASARWELLRRIEFRTTQRAVQPIGWGGRSSEAATFLGDRRTRYLRLARDHARELMAYFRSTLEDLVERVNDCEKIEELGINWKKLEESSHRMDFDQRRLLAGETSRLEKTRLRFICGPLKSLARAGVKAEEYEDEINDSKKSHVSEDGRRLLGCDLSAYFTTPSRLSSRRPRRHRRDVLGLILYLHTGVITC